MSPRSVRSQSRKLLVSALAVFAVFVLCVAYIIGGVLNTPLTSRPRNIDVELTGTGGLFEGSSVTYRGVRIGTITHIGFTRTGVEATARIDSDARVPADTRAVVRSLSPVGEQYLDFQPSSAKGPYLHDGSTITATHTNVPETLASTVISVNKLLDQIDVGQLHTLLDETHRALRGTGPDLSRMIEQGRRVIRDLNRYWPQTERLLTNGGTLLDIGTDNAARLSRMARDTRRFARFLRGYAPELRAVLGHGPGQVRTLESLLRDARAVMPRFLELGDEMTTLLASYAPHLRELLLDFAPGLGVLARAIRHGSLQLDLIPQRDDVCDYPGEPRDPRSTRRLPLDPHHHCPGSFPREQRGAAHAPGPVPAG